MSEEDFKNFPLPRNQGCVNLMSREGAHSYLAAIPVYLKVNLVMIDSLRAQLNGNNKVDAELQLEYIYNIFTLVVHFADIPVFEATLNSTPFNQLLLFWQHVESVLKTLSDDRRWKKTGYMRSCDHQMIQCLPPHFERLIACRVLLDQTTLLKTMASFMENSKKPNGLVCEGFLAMLWNMKKVMYHLMEKSFDEIYGLYEKTGVLGQALRCFAYASKQGRPGFFDQNIDFLDDLVEASGIVRKHLIPGTPTGDILATLVKQKGIQPSVSKRLQNLSRLSSYTVESRSKTLLRACYYCSKGDTSEEFQASLKACTKCKVAFYCNRECQIADWKTHKKTCKPPKNKNFTQRRKISEEYTSSFLKRNYMIIMIDMVNALRIGNYEKTDVMLVLDFVADASGVAPALQTPPVFSFVRLSNVINGVDVEPDWLYTGFSDQELKQWRGNVKMVAEMASTNDLVIASRAVTNGASVTKVQGKKFSEEAVRAFSLAEDGDNSGLLS